MKPATRGLVLAIAAILIVGPPSYRQLLGGKSKWARPWVMFSGIGLGLVELEFRFEGGPVQRYELLGLEAPQRRMTKAQRRVWRVSGPAEFERHGWRICEALAKRGDDPAGLSVHARIAQRRGWKVLEEGAPDFCARLAKKRGRRERRARDD